MREFLSAHSWLIDGALFAVLVAVVARGLGVLDNGRMVVTVIGAIGAASIAITRAESERQAKGRRRVIALRRLRECAGAFMKNAALFQGKAEPPEEWGQPRPPMNLEDLARALREAHSVWYATRETATVTAWVTAVSAAAGTFSACAQALVPDLTNDDRDLLQRAQHTATSVAEALSRLAGYWRARDSLRQFVREYRPTADFVQGSREPIDLKIGEACAQLADLLQRLVDTLLAIAKRAP